MYYVDLNSDLGESFGNYTIGMDREILKYVSSANVACGWQLIGRTPLKLYDVEREKPVLLEAGQYIKFRAVDEAEYEAIEKQVEAGTYQYVVFHKEVE